jgi:hypothetical protein
MKKLEKNYYRSELMMLQNIPQETVGVYTGKYKHSVNQQWITFTTIREYVPTVKTRTICDHVNFERSVLDKFINLTATEHNRKFYFSAKVATYVHYGEERGCLIIEDGIYDTPIWMAKDLHLHYCKVHGCICPNRK